MACCRRHSSRAVTIPTCASAAFPCIRYLAPVGVGDCCNYARNVGCCQRACFRSTPRLCSLRTRVTAAICTLPLRTGSSTLVSSWGIFCGIVFLLVEVVSVFRLFFCTGVFCGGVFFDCDPVKVVSVFRVFFCAGVFHDGVVLDCDLVGMMFLLSSVSVSFYFSITC